MAWLRICSNDRSRDVEVTARRSLELSFRPPALQAQNRETSLSRIRAPALFAQATLPGAGSQRRVPRMHSLPATAPADRSSRCSWSNQSLAQARALFRKVEARDLSSAQGRPGGGSPQPRKASPRATLLQLASQLPQQNLGNW